MSEQAESPEIQLFEHLNETALISGRHLISYRDLRDKAAFVGGNFARLGLAPGDRVATLLPNSVESVTIFWGAVAARITVCPLNPGLPLPMLINHLCQMDCNCLVTNSPLDEKLVNARVVSPGELLAHAQGYEQKISLSTRQPMSVTFTSGSTGTPKAVLLSVGNHFANARGSNQNIAFGPTDRWLLSLPLYHVGGIGILVRAMLSGGTVVLPEIGATHSDMIHKYGITHLSVVSTQLRDLVATARQRKSAFPTLKAVLLGGGPTSPTIISEAIGLGLPLHASYGLSEAASQVTTTEPGESALALQTSGRLLSGRELCISDDGEILIKGETLFQGYLESDSLRLPVDSSGWFRTGDLGYLDAKGYLHVTGRKDNMFISGGENIYPEEIEALLKECDGVIDAIVVPIDSEKWGKRPIAFVRLQNSTEHSQKNLHDQIAAGLPKFKIPDHIFPWPVEAPSGLKFGRPYFRDLAEQIVRSLG